MNISGGVRKQLPLFIYEESSFLIYKNAPLGMRTAVYKVGVASDHSRRARMCKAYSLFNSEIMFTEFKMFKEE